MDPFRGGSRVIEREVGGQNELRHHIASGLVETKKKNKVSQPTIASHLSNYAFIADKVHQNP